ncbi:TRAF3-interacting protein 1 [Eucyclogobius newberryi]|uniref:TRAF3-interacting protein 1 n=1 Tax=Eucyclogobius newberryi TaxID=166745 RepID=UPI003B5BF6A1
MDAALVKKTQESLGRVIKKPQLSEKYLRKPPFRFLHDIFTEVIKASGFMKGLYSEAELQSDTIQERVAKMAFLQKAIDVVVLVSGEPLSVKPARVVAGQEAEKTNELLQAIALCCLNKRSSEDAVRRVLSGDQPQEREEQGEEPRGAEVKSKRTKAEDGHKSGEAERRPKERAEEKERREKREERGKERERREEKGEEREKKEKREKSKEKTRSTDRERDRKEEKERERRRREKDQDRTRSKPREEAPPTQVKSEEPQNIGPEEPPPAESSVRIPRPSSAKGQRRRARAGQDGSDSEGDAEVKAPESEAAASTRMLRPSSARAAPPRGKKQGSHAEADRSSSAKMSSLILDGKKTAEEENDEDEQFLVQEAQAAAPDAHSDLAEAGDDSHGGLVKKILETKKYYEVSPSAKPQTSASVQRKEQDLVQREMERLRSSVQTICRSVLPLGKIMDYLQEDMDAMSAELQHWRHENQEHAQALQEEQRLTEGALLPLKTELLELDSLIQEQQAQNAALRCSICKNEERLHKMVTGLQHRA